MLKFILRLLGRVELIPFGIRDRVIRSFVNPDTYQSYEFVTDFFRFKYKGNLNSYIDWAVYFYGAYSKLELFLLRDLVLLKQDSCVVFDVGANVGNHSLFLSRFAKMIFAFEPYEPMRRKFEENISLNNISNVEIVPCGLGEEDLTLDYYAPSGRNLGTGSFIKDDYWQKDQSCTRLRVISGDDFVENKSLDQVDLIKIDVEGFEKFVLTGLNKTIIKFRPIIFMEYSDKTRINLSVDSLIKMLPEYKIFSVSFKYLAYRLSELNPNKPSENLLLMPLELCGKGKFSNFLS